MGRLSLLLGAVVVEGLLLLEEVNYWCLPWGPGIKQTVIGSMVGFGDAPVARSWSFYGRNRGLGWGAIGGLGLRGLLFLFAAAEEAAEASFDLG